MIELQPGSVLFVRSFLTVTAGIVVLFVGKALNRRISLLREYNIPEPVTGGLVFASAFGLLYLISGYRISFELTARDILLVYFFTTIGINARISDLKAGGRPLVILTVSVAVFLLLQNGLGVAVATIFGRPAEVGLLAGSVSLLGGHGTAIAWAPTFVGQGIGNAQEIGILCATAGLVLASLAGGPVARFLVKRHGLQGVAGDTPEVGVHYGDTRPGIDYFSFLHAILAIHVSAALGILAHHWLTSVGVTLPLFVPCLFAGILLTNALPRVAPQIPWPSHTVALALIAEVSLGVFLAMSLMSLQLWALADLAGPLVVLLGLQLALIVMFALVVTFRVLGRNYDAAVICAGFIGFGLGGTPTAMANMTGVTQRYGASHVAFVAVPLVGAFFIDLLNTVVIRTFFAIL
jgi:glutamate:Na+ symporter, ESS family